MSLTDSLVLIEEIDGEQIHYLHPDSQERMVGDVRERGEKLTDVDGYTIVRRTGRRPKVHLLHPVSKRCLQNVPSDAMEQIEGSRERVASAISNGGTPCSKCFPKEEDFGY